MELNQIPGAFQSRVRLSVIAALLTGPQNFRALQDLTGATPGNLGKQLELLEEDGFIQSKKEFVGRRPNTTYTLRQLAISKDYNTQMEQWIDEAEVVWAEGFENFSVLDLFPDRIGSGTMVNEG